MSATITIQLIGLDKTLNAFARLGEGLTRLKPLWELFGAEFYSQEKSLFNLAPWKPLSPAYEKRKRQMYGDKPILRATDTLFESLTQQGAAGNVHRVTDNAADFGSNVPYGIFHQNTRDPLAEPDEDRYNTIAGEYVDEVIKNAGFN